MGSAKTVTQISNDLAGSRGVIYLMFLGRETYIAQIQQPLLSSIGDVSPFFKNKENVNQAFEKLWEKGEFYLKYIGTEKSPGNPKIYIANMAPILETLREANIEFEQGYLETLLKSLSRLNDNFPPYLTKASTFGGLTTFSSRGLTWTLTLFYYFLFLAATLNTIHSKSSKAKRAALKGTPLFYATEIIDTPSISPEEYKATKEIFDKNPNIVLHLLNIAMALFFHSVSEQTKEMISYAVSLSPEQKEGTHYLRGQALLHLDTFIQFNRLVLWVFMPDHLSRSKIEGKVHQRLEKMLATLRDLDQHERAQFISDCWGSIATFWWCKELLSDGKCDVTKKICPVWPSPRKRYLPKISPLKCLHIKESLDDFLKGKRDLDYGQRLSEGKSISILDFILK